MARPRKPTALLKAKGTYRADRHGREMPAPAGSPASPRKLSKIAQRYWDVLVPQLSASGVLTAIDGEALSRFCELSAEFDQAESVDRQIKLSAALDRLGQQFGLTPSARAKIQVGNDAAAPARREPPAASQPMLRIAR